MTQEDYSELGEWLSTPRNVVITTHVNPDGDAIGSSLGLYHYLVSKGHQVQVITPNAYPEFLHWLPGNETVIHYDSNQNKSLEVINNSNIIFCLDFNTLGRVKDLGLLVENTPSKKVLIDHHRQPDDFADFMLSDITASSTAQLVYDFIEGLGDADKITVEIAECLYTGIMTDSGSFRFSSTSPRTHRIVAALMEAGLVVEKAHQEVYDTNTINRLNLIGYSLVEKLRYFPESNAAYISLSQKELNRFRYQKGDTEGLVNYALSIKGVRLAALFTEQEELIKVSLRSKGNVDVNTMARTHFNGGGHANAAGGASTDSLEETTTRFESLLTQYNDVLLS